MGFIIESNCNESCLTSVNSLYQNNEFKITKQTWTRWVSFIICSLSLFDLMNCFSSLFWIHYLLGTTKTPTPKITTRMIPTGQFSLGEFPPRIILTWKIPTQKIPTRIIAIQKIPSNIVQTILNPINSYLSCLPVRSFPRVIYQLRTM